jgi:hypothetical protein
MDKNATMVMRIGNDAFTPPTTPTACSFAMAEREDRVVFAHVLVRTTSRGSAARYAPSAEGRERIRTEN